MNRYCVLKYLFLLMLIPLMLSGCKMTPERALKKAYKYYDKADYTKALDYLELAWIGKPDDPEYLVRYAHCLIANETDPKYAIEVLYENSVRYPDYARTYYMLGNIAYNFSRADRQKNLMQAIKFTTRAAQLDTTDVQFALNLAQYYEIGDMADSALVWYERVNRLKQGDEEIAAIIDSLRHQISHDANAESLK